MSPWNVACSNRACQDRVPLVMGGCGKKALQQFGVNGHAARVQPSVLTKPRKRSVQVMVLGMRPAPPAGRQANANAVVFRAGVPVVAGVSGHVILARAAPASTLPRSGGGEKTSGLVGFESAHVLVCDVAEPTLQGHGQLHDRSGGSCLGAGGLLAGGGKAAHSACAAGQRRVASLLTPKAGGATARIGAEAARAGR